MAFSYNPDNATERDKLRLVLGDTDGDDYVFEDSELDIFLNLEGSNLNMAASRACRAIAVNKSKQAMAITLVSGLSIDRISMPDLFLRLAEKFESADLNIPKEYMDSFAVEISDYGEDNSEYVGDEEE